MNICRHVSTPMESSARDSEEDASEMPDHILNQEAIGSLLFLSTRTRPDILAAVGILSRRVAHPTHRDWVSVIRVFRYLRGTSNLALRTTVQEGESLCYSDADWAGDSGDRKSTTGVLMKLGDCTVVRRTMKQRTIAMSSTGAEFIPLSEAAKLVLCIRSLLGEFGCKKSGPAPIVENNQGAIEWRLAQW